MTCNHTYLALYFVVYIVLHSLVSGKAESGSKTEVVVVGISIQHSYQVPDLLHLQQTFSSFADVNVRYQICFDWSPDYFLASEELFRYILHQNIIIERFQSSAANDLCGLTTASAEILDYLYFSTGDSYNWAYSLYEHLSLSLKPVDKDTLDINSDSSSIFISLHHIRAVSDCVTSSSSPSSANKLLERCQKSIPQNNDNLESISKVTSSADSAILSHLQQRLSHLRDHHQVRDGPCQLWWPWNHSEIFIHKPVPALLQMLRVRTKTIIRCSFALGAHLDTQQSIPRFLSLDDCLHWDPTQQRCLQYTNSMFLLNDVAANRTQSSTVQHQTIQELETLLHIPYEDAPLRTKHHRLRILSASGMELSSFMIEQPVVYGTDALPAHVSSAGAQQLAQWYRLHPIVTQIDSRDDIGFALSSLFHLPSTDLLSESPKIWVEVGVQAGKYAELILRTTHHTELGTYVGVDSWHTWPEDDYVDTVNQRLGIGNVTHLLHREQAEQRLSLTADVSGATSAAYLQHRNRYLIALPSVQAASLMANASVDIVYIDAMHHYTAVWEDLLAWWPKVKPCGLLAGHDFLLSVVAEETVFTVKPAVQEFARRLGLLLLQTNDEERPSFPTWLLFKPCVL